MLFYDLSQRGDAARYDYLYKCIRHDIAHGVISAGEKLPSKRALAKHLGVGVITVEEAYTQLVAEGYVRAEERRGYFACELAPAVRAAEGVARDALDGAASRSGGREVAPDRVFRELPVAMGGSRETSLLSDAAACEPGTSGLPLRGEGGPFAFSGSAATSLFPYATWAKVMRQTLSEEASASLAEAASAAGSLRLRQAISTYLRRFRGMDAPADRIIVAAGSQTLYQLLVQLLGRTRLYAVEAPGYPLLGQMYRAQDARFAKIPVTSCGIDVAALEASRAEVAHVMPAHQFPTGAVMSAACRRSLLNWSREGDAGEGCVEGLDAEGPASANLGVGVEPLRGRFIVEDDYDAEFRMSGRPIPPLASIDTAGRVIYLNSFAKSLGSAFRIAYMVLPEALQARFERELGFYSNTVSPLEQLALARFIEQGHYERHVNRLRARAKRAQDAIVAALEASDVGERLEPIGLDGGFHFSIRVKTSVSAGEGVAALSVADEKSLRNLMNDCGAEISLLAPGWFAVNFEQAVARA